VIRDGWLYTGDLGHRDPLGRFYLVGRKKNLIITGGMKVNPEEVENVLRSHPLVREAVVKGEAAAGLGEVPVAYLCLKPDYELSLQQVHEFLRGKISEWKWPKKLHLRPAIPRNPVGKEMRQSVH